MAWVSLGTAVVGSGLAIYQGVQTNKAAKKAVSEQRTLIEGLKYEPIDIDALKREATATAIENATQSLALERSLTPNVAATREEVDRTKLELARQVGSELALEGNLSPDVINRVTTAGRVIGSTSGVGSPSTVPLTASLLGLTSMDVANQRRAQAAALQGPGAPPPVGLDPGTLASFEVAENAAQNQFNVAKASPQSNLINAEAAARTAQIGGQVGMISSLANLLGQGVGAYTASRAGVGGKTTYDEFIKNNPPLMTTPAYKPLDTTWGFV